MQNFQRVQIPTQTEWGQDQLFYLLEQLSCEGISAIKDSKTKHDSIDIRNDSAHNLDNDPEYGKKVRDRFYEMWAERGCGWATPYHHDENDYYGCLLVVYSVVPENIPNLLFTSTLSIQSWVLECMEGGDDTFFDDGPAGIDVYIQLLSIFRDKGGKEELQKFKNWLGDILEERRLETQDKDYYNATYGDAYLGYIDCELYDNLPE